MNKEDKEEGMKNFFKLVLGVLLIFSSITFIFGAPVGPDGLTWVSNETRTAPGAMFVNVSGGVISTFNLTANVQNPRWKAFVGEVVGSFTLDDAAGSTIYDWTLSSVTGRVYSTRTSGAVTWGSISCASVPEMESENTAMVLTSNDDNITATFDDTTHGLFYVGATQINSDSCPTLNTYVSNVSQDVSFEEMVLHDTTNIIYATILEENVAGFDGNIYDFQMIVPENGTPGFSGATPYYLYVELGN